mgnify:CR=1 FL=1
MRPGICAASVAWLRASILASALICVAKAWLWMRTVANSACAEAEPKGMASSSAADSADTDMPRRTRTNAGIVSIFMSISIC